MTPTISPLEAIVLAVVQGVSELFPVSSLGHAVIIPGLLGWAIDENAFLPFLTVMHLGTAIALLAYFWRDWFTFGMAVLGQGRRVAAERRLFLMVVVATLPAVVVGGLFEKLLRHAFAAPILAAAFLILNGLMLFLADRIRRPQARNLDQLRWLDAVVIGLWQCIAFIPGLSRSGATMAGGYRAGLNHADAARFSFLTGTPIILAATVLEAPKLMKLHSGVPSLAMISGAVAGVVALVSIFALMRWFRGHDQRGFQPFAIYCAVAGAASLGWLLLHR